MKEIRGRRLWTAVVSAAVLGLLTVVTVGGIAGAAKPTKVRAGNLEMEVNGDFKPHVLSKSELTPIKFEIEAKFRDVNGGHPPALKEFNVEADKNSAVNVKGYPTCKAGQLQSTDTDAAMAACKTALIGKGRGGVEIAFPEQPPIDVTSPLLVFSGGVSGGTTTFLVHAYITVPTPAAIVTVAKIKRVSKGRYGISTISQIPKIAGGSGSVTSFELTIDKKFTYKGKKVSVISAKCPDGKLQARGEAVFSDGTRAKAEVVRPCTPKG